MKHGAARAASRWLGVFSGNLIGIVSFGIENSVTIPGSSAS
jgi:hypothetical protein